MSLSPRSLKALDGVNPDLVRVIRRADELGARFHVTDGVRTIERQRELVKAGKSRTMKSRHITGHAVDLVVAVPGGGISYDRADMAALAVIVKQAAAECNVPIEWGGDWKRFVDMPHFQLPVAQYPSDRPAVEQAPAIAAAPAPLGRSGTVWGTITGAVAAAGAYAETWIAGLIEWAAKLTELGPAQAALAQAGGNVKAIMLGLGAGAAVYVISRRVKAAQEGKAG